MRSISRRELSHNSAQILDRVLDTGEAVEVVTRGRGSVIIAPKPESLHDQWVAQGLVKPASGRLSGLPRARSDSTVAEILADLDSDH